MDGLKRALFVATITGLAVLPMMGQRLSTLVGTGTDGGSGICSLRSSRRFGGGLFGGRMCLIRARDEALRS